MPSDVPTDVGAIKEGKRKIYIFEEGSRSSWDVVVYADPARSSALISGGR